METLVVGEAMSAPASNTGDMQLAEANSSAGKELAIVEEGAVKKKRVVLREEEEDIEVKLRRIMEHVPVRVSNTSGSSAGSGSGDFHQYRQMRRKEQDRLARMDADYKKRLEVAEFNLRREERLKEAEDRTAKKRQKRLKKKDRKKGKNKNQIDNNNNNTGTGTGTGKEEMNKGGDLSDNDESDSDGGDEN